MSISALQQQFESHVDELRKLQQSYSKLVDSRTQFETQLNENKLVQEELRLVDSEGSVYKLVGPALVKQDLPEAKSHVDKRIGFITTELDRLDKAMKEYDEKMNTLRGTVMKLQNQLMQQQASAKA
ncbi:hypothetical protein CAOG_05159 [Capsaspora owczarzaki ATCC 30864]|uniref:Prefoldin subunit 6 n=1 Tax=Capsaspora owczarzaki (strain ATCC 30864) TaxID=595528 RepID=A0A0D2UHE1_CAPO3|nr:hypothetical protein CAOG_05159 [Capsaspora owczarzaki ATCC 30864]KJE94526.1 hypothetical protein CAOG_005159 [Capsaspora owczarzaki ATCC 30864]|eukprot:XP_004346844.1 hypothetical protein CAOG_05159 [Capsaspora owczarzaki ATCC 30864]